MKTKATVRELHLKTSEILRRVSDGDTFVIEKRGTPVAEIRPVSQKQDTARLPHREAFLQCLPRVKTDSGAISTRKVPSLTRDNGFQRFNKIAGLKLL